MDAEALRAIQAPLKDRYRLSPESARSTLRAEGHLDQDMTCSVATANGPIKAGLHPATGGTGREACSGDMLLQALVACSGVTLKAVATAIGVSIRTATIEAEGDLDFRGTLGVSRDVSVGIQNIRLRFKLDTDATDDQIRNLLRLTERYCVVFQTLSRSPKLEVSLQRD